MVEGGSSRPLAEEMSGANASPPKVAVQYDVEEIRDVAYRPTKQYKHQMDIYQPMLKPPSGSPQPASPIQNAPVLIWVHGGGWKRFDRRDVYGAAIDTGRAFARKGVLTMAVSYRTSSVRWRDLAIVQAILAIPVWAIFVAIVHGGYPESKFAREVAPWKLSVLYLIGLWALLMFVQWIMRDRPRRWPSQMVDVAAAVSWVATHAAEYGGDPHSIVLAGHSAGGHIVTTLGLWHRMLNERGVKVVGEVGLPVGVSSPDNDRNAIGTLRGVIPLSAPLSGSFLRDSVFSRKLFMWPVFGPDPARWDLSFPEGQVQRWLGAWAGLEWNQNNHELDRAITPQNDSKHGDNDSLRVRRNRSGDTSAGAAAAAVTAAGGG